MRELSLCVVLVACGADDWQAREVVDDGRACLGTVPVAAFEPPVEQMFDATSAITVYVQHEGCLSGSCSREREASCTATRDGSTITIAARGTWEENVGEVPCTADCVSLGSTCPVGTLPDGTYTVVYGSESFELTVPGTQVACAGE